MSEHHAHEDCRELAERLSEFVDGELPEALRSAIEAHIDACSNCERFVASLRRVRALGASLPPPRLKPDELADIARRAKRQIDSLSE